MLLRLHWTWSVFTLSKLWDLLFPLSQTSVRLKMQTHHRDVLTAASFYLLRVDFFSVLLSLRLKGLPVSHIFPRHC